MKQNHKMNNGRMFSTGPGLDQRETLVLTRERGPGLDQREREALVLTRERERPWGDLPEKEVRM